MFEEMKFHFTAHVLTCAIFLSACSEPAETHSVPPPPPPPPTAPESMSARFCFETAQLRPLQGAVDTPALSAMIPSSARDFVLAQFEEAPAAAQTINENSRVCGLTFGEDTIFAAETTPAPHALGSWHGDAQHFGNVAVFGERGLVEDGGAYLARVVFAEEAEAPLTIHIEDGVVADQLRPVLDENLRTGSQSARSAAQAEQASRESEADFGDPQAFVRVVERRLRGLLQWMPDVGEVVIEVRGQGGAVHLDAHMDVDADSPLATYLAGAPTRESGFDRLPRGTALAYTRAGEGESVVAALVEVAGERAGTEEVQALLALAEGMPAPFTVALGTTGDSPWLDYQGGVPSSSDARAVLAGDYMRSLASVLFDCPRPPRAWPEDEGNPRCRLPPLQVREGGATLGDPPREVVGADPDIARLAAGAPALGGLYLDVLRLPTALSLFNQLEPRALSEDRAAPVLGTLHYEAGELHLRVRCAPGGVANLVDVALSLVL